jgi:hypothetical protein
VSEIIEVNDVVADTYGYELRVGDRVSLMLVGGERYGVVTEVVPSTGELHRQGDDIHAQHPAVVTARFDDGDQHTFSTSFIRLPAWRWVCDDLKRIAQRP